MKCSILTAIVLMTLSVTAIGADNLQTGPGAAEPGSPGTATPTPYPQVAPPSIPRTGGNEGNPPLLPKIDIPGPPKDPSLPGLQNEVSNSPDKVGPPKNP
ncbi:MULTISPECIES: hypothetical protein [unclassified Pseudomonas]|uniref:hypothetical protein n=1 Tax=unclassified Pseudomonas TaxID=196821 RepID=UPI002AC95313|nr:MULTISPECIES: hypothetical protein [unclassified Pseudomonas]MEB0043047.1 hypothetical protein [Pseudomonas sp. MH10]MEB0078176.1 hypothetical protein [Pseudomonas sp. MH10out]MEB0094412.1 hypothetical protein [Pseudomonas sp. CCI4.2]MEB0102230.1 hypothetical protein [Pseudomonas sp. CCI3.2]MEB0121438.1 hypothetical protein [Pseudomonas sp. CCI1.2]